MKLQRFCMAILIFSGLFCSYLSGSTIIFPSYATSMVETSDAPVVDREQGNENTADELTKNLIVYFSLAENRVDDGAVDTDTSASIVVLDDYHGGTTAYVASILQQLVGGDLIGLHTVDPYTHDFDRLVDQNHADVNENRYPQLVDDDIDIDGYDRIFIGYPVWASDVPLAVQAFLNDHDFTGKIIVPFCTHNGYGEGKSFETIQQLVDDQTSVIDGFTIAANNIGNVYDDIETWLDQYQLLSNHSKDTENINTSITITIDETTLNGYLNDSALAQEISTYFPLTLTMTGYGGRGFYGRVEFYSDALIDGQTAFENGQITYCDAHHNMAVFL